MRNSDAGIATRSNVNLYITTRRLSIRRCSRGRQFRSFIIGCINFCGVYQNSRYFFFFFFFFFFFWGGGGGGGGGVYFKNRGFCGGGGGGCILRIGVIRNFC